MRRGSIARFAWVAGFLAVLLLPCVVCLRSGAYAPRGPVEQIAVYTGVVAVGLLVGTVVLVGRVRSLLSGFGLERALRAHRFLAVAASVLVLGHVGAVLFGDPRHLAILDLRHTTGAARAGTVATCAFLAIVVLGLRRRQRQPRYEGWRLLHVGLFSVVLAGAWLHVWWLKHLEAEALFAGWLLLVGLVVVLVAVRRWVWAPLMAKRRPYVVEEVVSLGDGAVKVAVRAKAHAGIRFRPGQFAYLKIGRSPFVFEEHPFSISSTATYPRRKEFTVKALGDFSELLGGLRPGRTVFVDGAYGGLTTDGLEQSLGFVFIAGGIGVTPMLSMLHTLADRRDPRRHLLLMGARNMVDLALRRDVDVLRERLDLEVVDVLAEAPEGWPGERGRIDRALLDRWLPRRTRRHLEYFLCGPPAMVPAVVGHLRTLSVPARQIHTERFEVV